MYEYKYVINRCIMCTYMYNFIYKDIVYKCVCVFVFVF